MLAFLYLFKSLLRSAKKFSCDEFDWSQIFHKVPAPGNLDGARKTLCLNSDFSPFSPVSVTFPRLLRMGNQIELLPISYILHSWSDTGGGYFIIYSIGVNVLEESHSLGVIGVAAAIFAAVAVTLATAHEKWICYGQTDTSHFRTDNNRLCSYCREDWGCNLQHKSVLSNQKDLYKEIHSCLRRR